MTRATIKNLKFWIVQLLVTEALVIYPAVYAKDPVGIYERILAPISLLTVAPVWSLQDRAYGAFLMIGSLDAMFLSIMIFSVVRSHKIVGAVCLFVFNFLCVGFIAAGV
jgi:hypothetical protein